MQPELSYQHKMNGFPSFYQIVRSMTYRWASLSMLYGDDPSESNMKDFEKAGASGFGIGSNIIDKKALAEGDYAKITQLAKSYTDQL